MIILGVPKDPENYFIADSALAWELDKAGFSAKYLDDGVYYYRRNIELLKWVENEIKERFLLKDDVVVKGN